MRSKKLHGVVGSALEKAYAKKTDEHLGELAAHFLESGDKNKALGYFLKAGEKAAKVYANSEAASYYDSALRIFEEKGGELQEKVRVLETLGDINSLVGEYDACLKSWNEAMLLWNQMEEKQKVARLHRKCSNVLMHKMGNPVKAKEHQLKALEILEAEPESAELANLRSEMAHLYWHIGEMDAALPLAEKAVETANRLNDYEAIANSYMVLGKLARFQGDMKKSAESYQKALKIALEKGYTEIALGAYMGAGSEVDEWEGNETQTPIERCQKVYEMAKKAGAISQQSWIGDGLAKMYIGAGNLDMAFALAEESVALDRKIGSLHNLPRSLGTLGNVYKIWGEWDKAEKYFTEALSISQKQNIAASIAMASYLLGALNMAKEDFAKAREFFETAADLFRKSGVRFGEAALFAGVVFASIELGELEKAENQVNFLQMIAQKSNNTSIRAYADVLKARLLRAQKKYGESIEYFRRAFESWRLPT